MVFEGWKGVQEKERKRKWTSSQKDGKKTGFSKTKNKYKWFKKKKKETQIRDKPKHGEEAKQELKLKKNCFLLFIAGVALNPSFSNCDAERSADHNDGETFTHKESRRSKLAWNHISNKSIQNTVDQR